MTTPNAAAKAGGKPVNAFVTASWLCIKTLYIAVIKTRKTKRMLTVQIIKVLSWDLISYE